MSGPIARLPLGLLEVFDLRTLGNYPRQVGDVISPTYDVSALQYQNCLSVRGQATLSGISPTFFVGFNPFDDFVVDGVAVEAAVPAGEAWLVVRSALLVECQSDTGFQFYPTKVVFTTAPNSAVFFPVPGFGQLQNDSGNVTAGFTAGFWQHSTVQPFTIPPSAPIQLYCEGEGFQHGDAQDESRLTWFAQIIRLKF